MDEADGGSDDRRSLDIGRYGTIYMGNVDGVAGRHDTAASEAPTAAEAQSAASARLS